ncbi:SsrA-binding protein, partial [Bifidobacterium mongoliense]
MANKEQGTSMIAQNRRARHDYEIEEQYEAGIALSGTEVKSLREGRASLAQSFVSIDRR